jgi:enoyl-CoA hydratase/carnithine racemase
MTSNPQDAILFNIHDGVATITLNRPERRNAIDSVTRVLLTEAFDEANTDSRVRVVVLSGTGSTFCAGVDLKEVNADSGDRPHVLLDDPAPLAAPVAGSIKPVVAAVNGPAVGGGFELALAADVRIAATTASFALPEGRIGSIPGSGGTQRLFQAVPSSIAWKILLTGDPLSAEAAARYGLVSDIYEPEALAQEAATLAGRVARLAPLSLRALKLAGRAALEGTDGLQLERTLWGFLSTTEDRAEGRAAFREKRDPRYKGT